MKGGKMFSSTILLPLFLHTIRWCGCLAQEQPELFLNKFNYSKNFRTNVCDRQRALWNNSMEMPDALRGLTLSVVVTDYTDRENAPLFGLDPLGRIPAENPGFFVIIMDEVARRAGFNWRDRFGVAKPLIPEEDGDKTWTDILLWGVESFDISLEKWGYSLGRAAAEISFPVGYWDSSIVLVEHFASPGDNIKREMAWFAFLQPFSISTWIAILGAIFLTGIQFWYMEWLNPPEGMRDDSMHNTNDEQHSAKYNLYLAGIAFISGEFGFTPTSYQGYVLGFSFSFAALIVGSTYTANMASFLVAPTYAFFNYPNLEVAVGMGATLCLQGSGVVQTLLQEDYPNVIVSPQTSEDAIFSQLRPGGECDVAAHQYNAFRIFERNEEWNYDCSFATNGQFVRNIPAGMATKVDNGDNFGNCTSLISHVLDYHLNEMIADGFVDKAFISFLGRMGENRCGSSDAATATTAVVTAAAEEDPIRLGLQDVGGIFIFHLAISLYAIAVALLQFMIKRNAFLHNNSQTTLSSSEKATRTTTAHPSKRIKANFNLNLAEEAYCPQHKPIKHLTRPRKRRRNRHHGASYSDDELSL